MTNTLGCLIIDLAGQELTNEERELLKHPLVGGVILFTRNYASLAQLQSLCREIRAARNQPILIMVDQEGGRVQRFIPEFTRIPPMAEFGKLYAQDAKQACDAVQACGHLLAYELLKAKVDLSLAPVLDLYKGVSTVIGDRAFHADPEIVTELALAFITGMRQAGMANVGKHFPGHGSVKLDSHIAKPQDERTLLEIEQEDLIPFAKLSKQGLTAIMAAHIVFPKVDPWPVGYSRVWLQDILRTRLQFKGAIFTDCLSMEGANISTDYVERVTLARTAGCDFVLLCNQRQAVMQVLDQLPTQAHQVEYTKWQPLQGNFSRIDFKEREIHD